jgi:hypothetical protein
LLLVGAVAGYLPDTSTIETSNQWVIANGMDQATITVMVSNESQGPVSGAQVIFETDNPLYGTLSPVTIVSDKATSTFRANTTSGAAIITATITSDDGYTVVKTLTQYIDHDSPYIVTFSHPLRGNVTEEVLFNASFTDRHGNPIDNRNPSGTHTISLHVHGPSPDDCIFTGYGHDLLNMPLNPEGNLSINVALTSKIGNNYISMDPFGSISDKIESILAVATGEPYSLTGRISNGGILPAYNEIPANGVDKFTINYFLYDVYKNPLQNRSILISTNLTDELTPQLYRTNSLGQVQITYGPKVSVLTANITAVAEGYPNVTNISYAKFVGSNVASNLYLVVTPQTMASRDCDPSTTRQAKVVAILSDEWGIPVTTGEDVTFKISNIATAPYTASGSPSFESGSTILIKTNTTDVNGNAIIAFYPGSFVTEGQTGYSDGATGSCTIIATTGTYTSNPVTVEWKNFAYLSVAVNVTPRTVRVNDTIDINIQITGDGHRMVPGPVSVVLDLDTTSMMNGQDTAGGERFPNMKIAAKNFVGSLNNSSQVGLVTWGEYDNSQYWSLITNLSYSRNLLESSIDSLVNQGGQDISVRESIINATLKIITNPLRSDNEVGAIITLGASSYGPNDLTPMVDETWVNNGIRVYSISYVAANVGCHLKSDNITYTNSKTQDMSLLANQAHGLHFCCTNSSQVIEAFGQIRQNLSEIAGVNTTMDLNFENPIVNNETTWSGSDVFDYVVVDNGMTSPDSRTTILWPNNTRSFENQTDDWNDDYRLNFAVGTIRFKQTWETTFRLKILKEGIIDLFGNSTISYNDVPGNLHLPTTLITSVNDTPPGFQGGALDISDLIATKSGNFTDYVPLEWNLDYQGTNTATETLCYCVEESCATLHGPCDGPWVIFDTRSDIAPGHYTPRMAQMDVRNLPPGRYWVKVHGFAHVAGAEDDEITDPIMIGNYGVYIKLS